MSHTGLLRRYLIFFAGVLCSALGISLITLAGMGTSAVSSLAYVLTYVFPGVSLGTFTFVVNCVMLGGQILVLRKKFQPIQLLQIPATFVFSCCIDLWMSLLSGLIPQSYAGHWVVLLMGCTCLGLGVALEVIPNVLILPCEGFVRVCSQEFHWDFGKTKTGFDLTMVAAATLLSLLDLGAIYGLREGTVVCALTVGFISRFFCKRLAFLVKKPEQKQLVRADASAA
ncbi:hypothetical protein B5G34_06550 [Flavonifractor sp. An82]|uniref:YczE/YyaS/YitT family protein n=1 Tax=Flavonifractor sp. An82 TaxID=1965660 RepID=UPI000B38EB3C|nr:DUF6198 family protein [Flavonifractor sp. An82]OUN22528.1 hypothetical protein B5G34_06550 [Flavonifractor sp. An82]